MANKKKSNATAPAAPAVRGLVLAGYGLNCDTETTHALKLAGAQAEPVHIHDLVTGKVSLSGYHIMVFDGGFAWGDDHGAGVILATRLRNHLGKEIRAFLKRGGLVLGICNGFQALVNLGILPMFGGKWARTVALAANDCGNFQDRWVELVADPKSPCLFTKGIERVDMPIRHGEGKLVAEPETMAMIKKLHLAPVCYGNGQGGPAKGAFPQNPNGSLEDMAGLCDETGRVFGLMPHPEGFYRLSQHPHYLLEREQARRQGGDLDALAPGLGQKIFDNAVLAAKDAK